MIFKWQILGPNVQRKKGKKKKKKKKEVNKISFQNLFFFFGPILEFNRGFPKRKRKMVQLLE